MMDTLLNAWRRGWRRVVGPPVRDILGWPVLIEHDGPESDTLAMVERLQRVIQLATAAVPEHMAAVREHVTLIRVTRFPCRGAFLPGSGELIVELTFLADPARLDAEIGATLVHEGEHARLRGTGLAAELSSADEERACREVELAFGARVPGGERVLERARAALELADGDVAPTVDWQEAWRRVDAG